MHLTKFIDNLVGIFVEMNTTAWTTRKTGILKRWQAKLPTTINCRVSFGLVSCHHCICLLLMHESWTDLLHQRNVLYAKAVAEGDGFLIVAPDILYRLVGPLKVALDEDQFHVSKQFKSGPQKSKDISAIDCAILLLKVMFSSFKNKECTFS